MPGCSFGVLGREKRTTVLGCSSARKGMLFVLPTPGQCEAWSKTLRKYLIDWSCED